MSAGLDTLRLGAEEAMGLLERGESPITEAALAPAEPTVA